MDDARSDRGLLATLIGDGRPLLSLTGILLLLSGLFAIFLATRREFLPHDIAFLGMSADDLCKIADCRVVGFMFHDRVSFGGTLIAIALFYLWLTAVPLAHAERWAWQTLAISGAAGFLSFLAYLGYGYLDTWHGAATLALLPCFVAGLVLSSPHATRRRVPWLATASSAPRALRVGRWLLVATAAGLIAAGATILTIGMTQVFVATDLVFIGLDRQAIASVSPRLIPLIAHDRAGFGGGLVSTGLLIGLCAWYAEPSKAFRQTVIAAGLAGFGCGIGVHFVEGYIDWGHLAPAVTGFALFSVGASLEVVGSRSGRVGRVSQVGRVGQVG